MIEWLVKKVICGKINDLLKQHKDNVGKLRTTLYFWTNRIEKVLACFKSIISKLDDNELDADELRDSAEEVTKLVREW